MSLSSEKSFLMGMDPEIVFVDPKSKQLLRADAYLPNPHTGRTAAQAELGSDGHPWIGEMRPPPGTPEELADHCERIIREGREKLPPGTIWKAGAFPHGKPCGGHIHFGFPENERVLDACDGVLAQVIAAIENDDDARRRRASPYGHLHDTRPQPWGWEYRTLASFVFSKSITLGILALAKAIAFEERVKGSCSISKLKGAAAKVVKVDAGRYNAADRGHFIALLPDLWRIISKYQFWKTPEGKRTWRFVAGLRQIAQYKEGWDNGQGMLQRWKIEKPLAKPQNAKWPTVIVPDGLIPADEFWWALANAAPEEFRTVEIPQIIEAAELRVVGDPVLVGATEPPPELRRVREVRAPVFRTVPL